MGLTMFKQNLALFLPPASALSTLLKAFFLSGCTLLPFLTPSPPTYMNFTILLRDTAEETLILSLATQKKREQHTAAPTT